MHDIAKFLNIAFFKSYRSTGVMLSVPKFNMVVRFLIILFAMLLEAPMASEGNGWACASCQTLLFLIISCDLYVYVIVLYVLYSFFCKSVMNYKSLPSLNLGTCITYLFDMHTRGVYSAVTSV